MAIVKKSNGRKHLAEGKLSLTYSVSELDGEIFIISVPIDNDSYGSPLIKFELSRNELFQVLRDFSCQLAFNTEKSVFEIMEEKSIPMSNKRCADALRKIADLMDK